MTLVSRPDGRLLNYWHGRETWEIWEVRPVAGQTAHLWANIKILTLAGVRRIGRWRVFYLGWSFDDARFARSSYLLEFQTQQPELYQYAAKFLTQRLTPEYASTSGWPYNRDLKAVAAALEASRKSQADRARKLEICRSNRY